MDSEWFSLMSLLASLQPLGRTMLRTSVVFVGLFLGIAFLECLSNPAAIRRYLSRHFRTDILYGLFYQGGIYHLCITVPLFTLLEKPCAFLKVGLLLELPRPLGYVLFWVLADLMGYWMHRWQHTSRVLWSFHCVHHSQTQMTFVTSNRLHLMDQLLTNCVLFVPWLILGVPTFAWLPVYLLQQVLEGVQHAELPWRYGPLYRIIVSPVFHAIHHSTQPEHYNKNYAKILSVWDIVFGTAVCDAPRPRVYGVVGLSMPESLTQHFFASFALLWRAYKPTRTPVTS